MLYKFIIRTLTKQLIGGEMHSEYLNETHLHSDSCDRRLWEGVSEGGVGTKIMRGSEGNREAESQL